MKSPSPNPTLSRLNRSRNSVSATALTKRLASLTAALGLLACSTATVKANDLFNGNLDDISISSQNNPSPTGWTIEATKSVSGQFFDGADSEPWCNVEDPGGYGL